jgi:hypothetical protein
LELKPEAQFGTAGERDDEGVDIRGCEAVPVSRDSVIQFHEPVRELR